MTPAQRRRGFRRSVALFLLALFLGTGTTLPAADALVYHLGDAVETQRPHIEPAGGCARHVEACTLGRAATGADAVLAFVPGMRVEPDHTAVGEPPPLVPHIPLPSTLLPQPRAPPVGLV
jgi:hypothetical protein